MDCLFCKIAKGEIPADVVYEDEYVVAFKDIDPQAPIHVLVIPKRHMPNILCANSSDLESINKGINEVVKKLNIENGFRVVVNTGRDANQTVEHLHYHILAGRNLSWPPG